jgi:hypothetical protein
MDIAISVDYGRVGWSADRIRFRRSFTPARCVFSNHPSRLSGLIRLPLSFDLESKTTGLAPTLKRRLTWVENRRNPILITKAHIHPAGNQADFSKFRHSIARLLVTVDVTKEN